MKKNKRVLNLLMIVALITVMINVTSTQVTAAENVTITTKSLPDGTVGVNYNPNSIHNLTATGDTPITWIIVDTDALPNGLFLDKVGIIWGTPTTAGTFFFRVIARNSMGSVEQELSITINGTQSIPPTITTQNLQNGTLRTPYSQTLTATGTTPITWAIQGKLPDGLTFSSTGLISGTPTMSGTFVLYVFATNSMGSDTRELSITINDAQTIPITDITIIPNTLTLTVGHTSNLTANIIPANATNKNVMWHSNNPNIATVENGRVVGIIVGTAIITVITEDGGKTATCVVNVISEALPPTIITQSLPNGRIDTPYNQPLNATGNIPIIWNIDGGTLPDGLILNTDTGIISGTPRITGTFNFTIRATNGIAPDAVKSFYITITGDYWDDYPDDPDYRYWDGATWNGPLWYIQPNYDVPNNIYSEPNYNKYWYDETWYNKETDDWTIDVSPDDICRHIVLILDVSGSMKGKPLTELKKSATAFCEYMLKANEGNCIAIIAYSSKAKLLHDFTNDYQALASVIDKLKSGGNTNMYDGLDLADKLLSSNSANSYAVKQIFLMSDGLPNAGATSNTGIYTKDDYSNYRYANAVFNKANEMKDKGYNMLTLGFFHANTKSEFIPKKLRFAIKFIEEDLPCNGFKNRMKVVNNPDDLLSRFIVAADLLKGIPSICSSQLSTQPTTELPTLPQSSTEPIQPETTQPLTEPTTQPLTEPTQSITEPPTQPTTQPPTEPPTQPITELPTEPPIQSITTQLELDNSLIIPVGQMLANSGSEEDLYWNSSEKLPQTGMLYLPIPILATVGVLTTVINMIVNRKKKKSGKKPKVFLTLVGVLIIFSSGGVMGYNIWDSSRADNIAEQTTLTLYEQIENYEEHYEEADIANAPQLIKMDNELYVGILRIPSLAVELPINNEWNDERLKASPCRYTGDITGSMIVCAHNYKTHFGEISTLSQGDKLVITDATGNEHWYTVELITTIKGTDIDAMVNNPYDLTLFTCTLDRMNRITVRCAKSQVISKSEKLQNINLENSPKNPLILKEGNNGADVKDLQIKLHDIGFYTGNIDSSFGAITKSAVIKLQKSYNLTPDGIVSGETWVALDDAIELATPNKSQ